MQPFAKMWEQRVQGKWFCHGVQYYRSMKGLYKMCIHGLLLKVGHI